jgi:hypothetical protein
MVVCFPAQLYNACTRTMPLSISATTSTVPPVTAAASMTTMGCNQDPIQTRNTILSFHDKITRQHLRTVVLFRVRVHSCRKSILALVTLFSLLLSSSYLPNAMGNIQHQHTGTSQQLKLQHSLLKHCRGGDSSFGIQGSGSELSRHAATASGFDGGGSLEVTGLSDERVSFFSSSSFAENTEFRNETFILSNGRYLAPTRLVTPSTLASASAKLMFTPTSSSSSSSSADVVTKAAKSWVAIANQVTTTWFALPSPFRYLMSGNIGTICLYTLEYLLAEYIITHNRIPSVLHPYREIVTYFVGYLLHIIVQHYSHALLVYGIDTINTRKKYISTLLGMYATLMSSAIGSTMVNAMLLHCTNNFFTKKTAFITTLVLFAGINYFVLQWMMKMNTVQ